MAWCDDYPDELGALTKCLEEHDLNRARHLQVALYVQERLGWKIEVRLEPDDLCPDGDKDWWVYVVTPQYPGGYGAYRVEPPGSARNLMWAGAMIAGAPSLCQEFLEAHGIARARDMVETIAGKVSRPDYVRRVYNGGRNEAV